jgi:hypothetical protein
VNPFDSRGNTTLIFGLIGLIGGLLCGIGFLMGPVAWITGNGVKRDAQAAGWPEPGNNKGGRICGIIATVFLGFGVLAFAFFLIAVRATNP